MTPSTHVADLFAEKWKLPSKIRLFDMLKRLQEDEKGGKRGGAHGSPQ